MNRQFPVYTIENECQDCYKCVRHCRCKAIRIVNARATVIPNACVACGECVKVCPAHAKKIRSDMARLLQMIANGDVLCASVAPSFPGYFRNVPFSALAGALKRLGFTYVSETAHGAQVVSAATGRFLEQAPDGVYLSSACPAAVDYIRKYRPEYASGIVPFDSPVIAHCKLLKKELGQHVRTIFIGPCAAKKNEADAMSNILDLAITFASMEQMMAERNIIFDLAQPPEELALGPAEEGRIYAIEGGMNDTIRSQKSGVRYIAVSGLDDMDRLLGDISAHETKGEKIFIEALACSGGCVNGPVMGKRGGSLDIILATDRHAAKRTSLGRDVPVAIGRTFQRENNPVPELSPDAITKALERVGKYTREDELNCGACGYDSCRDFAMALLQGKAEEAMCHNYLRRNFQRTSNALIKYIPAGVVLFDQDLQILEANRHFAELIDEETVEVYDSLGNLAELNLGNLTNFTDLFESVIANGGEIEKFNQTLRDRIVNISIFSIAEGKTAGAVIQDVTKSELQREQIADKAKEIIRKNVMTVQQVARLFGEHIAESEILLNQIAGSYSNKKE